jgi:hypothetical protein
MKTFADIEKIKGEADINLYEEYSNFFIVENDLKGLAVEFSYKFLE